MELFILIGGAYALYTVGMAIATDLDYREVNKKLEDYRAKKKKVTEQVAVSKRDGTDSNDQIAEMRKLGEHIKQLESELKKVKIELNIK